MSSSIGWRKDADAQLAPDDLALVLELEDDLLGQVGGDGEADADVPPLVRAVRMLLLMPMTSPFRLTSGPPELPRLMAASVWMKSS